MAVSLGARLLQAAPVLDAPEGHQVYADPAGHLVYLGRGDPTREPLRQRFATPPRPPGAT